MKTVLITGGSRGIGRAAVKLFSKNGYRVAFTYKSSEEEAKALARECGALAIKADSESESDIISAVSLVESELGGIDILINNAAVSSFSLLTDISLAEWRRVVDTSLTGAFLYSREALRSMIRKKWGRIVNVSSMWGLVGSSCEVHYSAAKAGLIGFTKALAKEVGPSGITVNAVAPGVIDTDMNSSLSDEELSALCDETPVSRIGSPEEVAKAIYFLAGDDSSFVTGEILNISGGFVV
ncbi:MAG: 3-oxoacyl-ACP reductase FabG [Clostridia bacterium]|nr:3-oxoacyl-ACP reductase FabG [Clostridia bacterium]